MNKFCTSTFVVPLIFYFYWIFDVHPCGTAFGIFEAISQRLYLDQYFWEQLPQKAQLCFMQGGVGGVKSQMPLRPQSYQNALRTMFFGHWSRDHANWKDTESYKFERDMEAFLGVERCFFVNTGTQALVLAIQAMGIGPGDEVIVPTYTWIATASSVTVNGAIPVLAEVDETLGLNPRKLESYITPRTKAIAAIHLQGMPCNITAIRDVAKRNNLYLLEDAAQAFGSRVNGKFIGTFGQIGITSTNPIKLFHSGSQGGLVWTTDKKIAERLQWAVDNRVAAYGGIHKLPGYAESFGKPDKEGEIMFAGHDARPPSEWHAAFGRSELSFLLETTKKLNDLKQIFINTLKPEYLKLLQPMEDPLGERAYAIWLILEKQEHVVPLGNYLKPYGINFEGMWWKMHYLPHYDAIIKKISWHESGFPWVAEEDKKHQFKEDFDASTAILNRSFRMLNSWHYTPPMMRWMANRVNDGLDKVTGGCATNCPNNTKF